MILRLSDSPARGLVVATALLVGLWLCFFGIRMAIARYGSEGETAKRLELAVRLEPDNPAYWYTLGRYQQYNFEQAGLRPGRGILSKSDCAKSRCYRCVVGSRYGLRAGREDRRSARGVSAGEEELSCVRGCFLAIWKLSSATRRIDRRRMRNYAVRSRRTGHAQRQRFLEPTGPIRISMSFWHELLPPYHRCLR